MKPVTKDNHEWFQERANQYENRDKYQNFLVK